MSVVCKSFGSKFCKKIEIGLVISPKHTHIFIMLHGYGGSIEEVDRLFPLEEYALKYQILIVVPELGNTFYLDRKDVDGKNNFVISRFLGEELPAYLKKEFVTKEDAEVILGGYSMGGFGAMLHGINSANNYEAIISVSGAFVATEIAFGSDFAVGTYKQRKEAFDVFMIKDGEVLVDDIKRNPEAAVRQIENVKRLPKIVLTCAKEDVWYSTTQRMRMELMKRGILFDYYEIVGGGHDFKEFNQGFRFAFNVLFGE